IIATAFLRASVVLVGENAVVTRPGGRLWRRPTIRPVPRRLAILGSTGSIGVQALDVVSRSTGELRVVALSAGSAWESLLEQAQQYGVGRIALADEHAAARAAEAWTDGEVLSGTNGIVQLI